jgi:hypothetical protein
MPAEYEAKNIAFLTACIETSAFSMWYGGVTICFAKFQQNLTKSRQSSYLSTKQSI